MHALRSGRASISAVLGLAFSAFTAHFVSQSAEKRRAILMERLIALFESQPVFIRAVRDALPANCRAAFDVFVAELFEESGRAMPDYLR